MIIAPVLGDAVVQAGTFHDGVNQPFLTNIRRRDLPSQRHFFAYVSIDVDSSDIQPPGELALYWVVGAALQGHLCPHFQPYAWRACVPARPHSRMTK